MMEKYFHTQQIPLQIQSKKPELFWPKFKDNWNQQFSQSHYEVTGELFFSIFTDYCCYSEFYVLGGALMLLEYSHAVIETLLLFFMLFSTHHSTLT